MCVSVSVSVSVVVKCLTCKKGFQRDSALAGMSRYWMALVWDRLKVYMWDQQRAFRLAEKREVWLDDLKGVLKVALWELGMACQLVLR
jgi:hypothetical protein